MNLLDAIILGLVEGVTEFLPISSTGHLIIVSALLGLGETDAEKRAVDAFNIMIQGGAILAVLSVYRARVAQMIAGLFGRDRIGLRLAVNLMIAFLPAAIAGVLLNAWIERELFAPGPVAAALFVGGILLLVLRDWQQAFFQQDENGEPASARSFVDIEHLTWRRALIIGLLQCLALWPGTSRSMMTIVAGMLVGMRAKHAAEFSFLLGLPTLGGACVYKAFDNFILDDQNMFDVLGVTEVIVGALVAFVSAALAVKWLIAYLNRHGVSLFGWYRIALAALLLGLISTGVIGEPAKSSVSAPISHIDNMAGRVADIGCRGLNAAERSEAQ